MVCLVLMLLNTIATGERLVSRLTETRKVTSVSPSTIVPGIETTIRISGTGIVTGDAIGFFVEPSCIKTLKGKGVLGTALTTNKHGGSMFASGIVIDSNQEKPHKSAIICLKPNSEGSTENEPFIDTGHTINIAGSINPIVHLVSIAEVKPSNWNFDPTLNIAMRVIFFGFGLDSGVSTKIVRKPGNCSSAKEYLVDANMKSVSAEKTSAIADFLIPASMRKQITFNHEDVKCCDCSPPCIVHTEWSVCIEEKQSNSSSLKNLTSSGGTMNETNSTSFMNSSKVSKSYFRIEDSAGGTIGSDQMIWNTATGIAFSAQIRKPKDKGGLIVAFRYSTLLTNGDKFVVSFGSNSISLGKNGFNASACTPYPKGTSFDRDENLIKVSIPAGESQIPAKSLIELHFPAAAGITIAKWPPSNPSTLMIKAKGGGMISPVPLVVDSDSAQSLAPTAKSTWAQVVSTTSKDYLKQDQFQQVTTFFL